MSGCIIYNICIILHSATTLLMYMTKSSRFLLVFCLLFIRKWIIHFVWLAWFKTNVVQLSIHVTVVVIATTVGS